MKIGEAGIALIKSFEKCVLTAYLPTPNDRWTIGWGSTKGVSRGDVWTQEKADARFLEDIAWVEECVNKAIPIPLTQNEFDAAASLCYNIGCPAFGRSTLVKRILEGDFDGAAAQFARWNRQGSEVLAGLTRRRAAEAELFETA